MWLKSDVISYNRKTIYGVQGERVDIISEHIPAVLVRSEKGNSFATTMDNLSPTKIQKIETKNTNLVKANRIGKPKK
jgi:hypothetical protein